MRRQAKAEAKPQSPGSVVADEATAEAFRAALGLQQSGRLAEAERAWQVLRQTLPDHDGINMNLATVYWRLGQLDDAQEACDRAAAANPGLAEAQALLGAIAQAQGNDDAAIESLEKAVTLKPELVTAWVTLANLYKDREAYDRARECCEKAEALDPGRADVLNTLGVVQQAADDWEAAETAFRRALETAPPGEPVAQIQTNLAALLMGRDRFEEAAQCCRVAITAQPRYAQAHNTLGAALKAARDLDGAEAAFTKALECDPAMAGAQSNLGTVFGLRRQWDQALACYDRALQMNPASAEAHNNRGNVLHSIGRYADAKAEFDRAIELDPDFPDPRFNRGLLALMQGHWEEGWPGFAWRWRTPQMAPFRRPFTEPEWDGAVRPAETLLLHAEQGMGDTLQFIRYAPLAAERVGRVVLECQPSLVPLLAGMPGLDVVVGRGEALPAFDLQVPLLSLPGLFGTTVENVPAKVPYLHVPAGADVRLPMDGDGLKVGLVWAGNPRNPNDPSRSAGLRSLLPLLDVPGCRFFSLQHGPPGDQIAEAGVADRLVDLRPELTDFAATAALVDQLDLVISICTSVAHLAGGMGAETWVTLSQDADWRWLRERDDSPWYPTVRLFRQRDLDDWDELTGRVAKALRERAGAAT